MSVWVEDLSGRLTVAFHRIHETRMRGLPILNPALSVQVVGARAHAGDWLGVLVTPWCMNLVLIPGTDSEVRPGPQGSKLEIDLPGGRCELIASEEAGIGRFAACSIFSPMGGFPDQATAVATAEAVLDGLLSEPAHSWPTSAAGISRRDLLRGRLGS
ncbi:[NiFe]-hydrogenase assembly chaperone HybE [Imhoffiella purpurea]|uniref:Hydrogenase maturation factor HoxT/HybE n=1 Tax=Imhoffiella purpurea TaxID=1249627 RepID=W9V6P3_9GAMM|nr:[NiFe]-hydrogenase assembly chaperone HybE [Imhoffiella purpurea]EXJ15233.1 Hydrogenase maturation factor HoxT/HybE [Imhoffiella purpurea]